VTQIGAWLRAHHVDAWYHHDGVLGARAGRWQDGVGATDGAAFCAEMGLADRMRPLTAEQARAVADSPRFVGGAFLKDCATVQPARMARGLRRVLLERGAHIFERTQVTGIRDSSPAVVMTSNGRVRASQVVLTTGAWAASWPGFRRSFGVIVDYMVATASPMDAISSSTCARLTTAGSRSAAAPAVSPSVGGSAGP